MCRRRTVCASREPSDCCFCNLEDYSICLLYQRSAERLRTAAVYRDVGHDFPRSGVNPATEHLRHAPPLAIDSSHWTHQTLGHDLEMHTQCSEHALPIEGELKVTKPFEASFRWCVGLSFQLDQTTPDLGG